MEYLWGVVVVGGPLLLIGVILWSKLHNRMSRKEWQNSEKATKQMHEEQNREDMMRE